MITSFTNEEMTEPKAAPIMTPTARSTALPFTANSLNSFQILFIRRYSLAFSGLQSHCAPSYRQFDLESSGSTARQFLGLPLLQGPAPSFDRAVFRLFELPFQPRPHRAAARHNLARAVP